MIDDLGKLSKHLDEVARKCDSEDGREPVSATKLSREIAEQIREEAYHLTSDAYFDTDKAGEIISSALEARERDVRELIDAWNMLHERGVAIYATTSVVIDRDAYMRTENAVAKLRAGEPHKEK
ncbi:MAG TPA: hypothetical protein VHV32_19270 [Candidatus Angelobacter sp.]|jgi:hypothetical protein|nr:hypothetical protein [Candidatus Angelobacter sp.]